MDRVSNDDAASLPNRSNPSGLVSFNALNPARLDTDLSNTNALASTCYDPSSANTAEVPAALCTLAPVPAVFEAKHQPNVGTLFWLVELARKQDSKYPPLRVHAASGLPVRFFRRRDDRAAGLPGPLSLWVATNDPPVIYRVVAACLYPLDASDSFRAACDHCAVVGGDKLQFCLRREQLGYRYGSGKHEPLAMVLELLMDDGTCVCLPFLRCWRD